MTSKIFGSIVALVLACSSATAADIRRVVTALDGNDKAIALFDGRVTLERGHDAANVGCRCGGAGQDERDDRAEDLAGHCVLLCAR